jgi:hypothetical protein
MADCVVFSLASCLQADGAALYDGLRWNISQSSNSLSYRELPSGLSSVDGQELKMYYHFYHSPLPFAHLCIDRLSKRFLLPFANKPNREQLPKSVRGWSLSYKQSPEMLAIPCLYLSPWIRKTAA